ncbi:MAG: MFS transporter [Bacteroidetes bacterium]|nr:MFS transporter [Bacteroidota bacterium]
MKTPNTRNLQSASIRVSAVSENSYAAIRETKSYYITLFVFCFLSSMLGGTVSTLMSVYLPVVVQELMKNVGADKINDVGAYINAVFIFGWTIGGVVWGIVGDKTGRKRSFILSTACYGIFTLLTSIASSWYWVLACRFMSGFGVGGVLVATTILVAEGWSDKKRAVMLGILSVSIPVGIFSAGLINFFLSTWRQAFLIGIVPSLLAIFATFVFRGSAGNDRNNSDGHPKIDTGNFLSAQYRKNLVLGSIIFGTMLIGLWAIFSWLPTWVQTVSSENDAQHGRGISMMILGSGGLLGGFISGWVVNAFGLRRTMIACFSVCFVMAFILFKLNINFSGAAYFELALLALFFGISQGALSVYIPQLFPAKVRASATGFCFNIGRLFTAFAVFFVGSLVSFFGGYGNAIFVFSFVFAIGLVMTILNPGTTEIENGHDKN